MTEEPQPQKRGFSRRQFLFGAASLSAVLIASTLYTDLNPPPKPFTIFWITDTQFLSEEHPELFLRMTNWIVSNWETYNGKFLIHTGDMVQNGGANVEWTNADNSMKPITQAKLPYSWSAGNHDDLVGSQSSSGWMGNVWTSSFNPTFAEAYFPTTSNGTWVGSYHEGMNTAQTFEADGKTYLVINLEWDAAQDAFSWVDSIFSNPSYANLPTILCAHAFIDSAGDAIAFSNYINLSNFVDGFSGLMDAHPNIFLTLNGHYATDCGYNTVNENVVQLMFDRQNSLDVKPPEGRGVDDSTTTTPDFVKVGGATVTLLQIDTSKNLLTVSTYDAYTGQWRTDPSESYTSPIYVR